MMPLSENGVTVHFTDDNYFQFSDCPAYRSISNQSVKEMDICWLDIQANILWAVELKAFVNPDNSLHKVQDINQVNIADYWIDEFYKKAVHTLCMLETNRSDTKNCTVTGINSRTDFKLVFLINVLAGQELLLNAMQDKLRVLLRPYLTLFNVSTMVIMAYGQARNNPLLPWIV
jgi:hypothetical protein